MLKLIAKKTITFFFLLYPLLANSDLIYKMSITGAIGAGTSDYIGRGIDEANALDAKLIVLTIDTPGGLDLAMRNIIQDILASKIPVASYVYPSGSRAASAGTYILYASHIAAMAPGTNLGAATPVSMLASPDIDSASKDDHSNAGNDMLAKAKNDSTAYIRSLAELRKRDIKFAEESVTDADAISSEVALKRHVIDFMANDINELIEIANGKSVNINGKIAKIEIKNPTIKEQELDFKTRFLLIISDPSIVYMLFIAGIYGLFLEFSNPGLIVPGVLGGIAVLIALYGMNSLPINYVGLGLIVLGVMFIIAEFYVVSYGVLGLGGLISMLVGSVFLYDSESPAFTLSYEIIGMTIGLNIILLLGALTLVVRSQRRGIVTGDSVLLNNIGVVITDIDKKGKIRINGEIWNASADEYIPKGSPVEVIKVTGLQLTVKNRTEEI